MSELWLTFWVVLAILLALSAVSASILETLPTMFGWLKSGRVVGYSFGPGGVRLWVLRRKPGSDRSSSAASGQGPRGRSPS